MLRLTNSEVHIIMGNTHAIAKKSTFIKKHPTLHIQNYAGNSYSAAGYKKTGYNSGKSASLNELRGKFYIKEPGSAITHFIGMIMALIAAFPLLIKAAAQPDPVYLISMSVYAASLILLYAASTTYHTFDISEKGNTVLKKIDHMMISVLIAGSYTPVCLLVLEGRMRIILLAVVWTLIDRYTDQSFLGILSEMGFFRSLYRNGMDVCPCICTDFPQYAFGRFRMAACRRYYLHSRRYYLCIESTDFQ